MLNVLLIRLDKCQHLIGKNIHLSTMGLQILNYFNEIIREILNYYSCAHNRNELTSIFRLLNYSCGLTLARKFKLKNLAKTFKKFGRDLTFKDETGEEYKIIRPINLEVLPMNKKFIINQTNNLDKLLR